MHFLSRECPRAVEGRAGVVARLGAPLGAGTDRSISGTEEE